MTETSILRELRTLEDAQQLVSEVKDSQRNRAGRLTRELIAQKLEATKTAVEKPTPPELRYLRDFYDGKAEGITEALQVIDGLLKHVEVGFDELDRERKMNARRMQPTG